MTASARIAETFVSVQGEGRLTGTRSWFCRFSGCNLRCRWCDTDYASWSPEGPTRTVADLLDEAKNAAVAHAVITGGEPMIFDAIEPLCQGLANLGLHTTIETAGTVHRNLPCDLMSISPKLADSTPLEGDPRDPDGAWRARHERDRIDHKALQRLLDTYPERQLKFVVADPTDLAEIESILATLSGVAPADVMLMPEGDVQPSPDHESWVRAACDDRGWVYCHRLHIELFGNTRGT